MTQAIEALVVRGQGIAGDLLSKSREHFEAVLGTSIHPASLNLRVDRVFESWPWRLRPSLFNEDARRLACAVSGVEGFIVFVENPAPSYNEGHDWMKYPDKTMLEIICTKWVPNAPCDVTVRLETDLSAL